MGTSGTALYSDDTCCEVRDAYVNHLKVGLSGDEASQRILHGYGALLKDDQVACLVYLALADTAWKYGRLDKLVRARALALLTNGGDITGWQEESPADVPARRRVLQALEARLRSPQPDARAIRIVKPRPKKVRTTAPVGSLFLMKLPRGGFAAFVLVGFFDLGKSIEPVFSVLDWSGSLAPEGAALKAAAKSTLMISSGLGPQAHVGLIAEDRRRNVMACLQPTALKVDRAMPFNPESLVFRSVKQLAEEIDAHFKT